MAYTLSKANNDVPYTFEVNGTAVTLPYTLQDGDVIQIYISDLSTGGILYINGVSYSESSSPSINVSDTNIVINREMEGASN